MKNFENRITFYDRDDVWGRDGTYDLKSAKEVIKTVKLLDPSVCDTVLDIGGHIGAFARQCLKRGAGVITVEPDQFNLQVLQMNTSVYQTTGHCAVIKGCATDEATALSGTVTLFLGTNGIHTGLHSIHPSKGRPTVEVKAYDFRHLILQYEPSILKVDIEGGEWNLDFAQLPDFIKKVHVEMHFVPISIRPIARVKAPLLHQDLLDQGFTCIKQPNFNVLWGTHPVYVRN